MYAGRDGWVSFETCGGKQTYRHALEATCVVTNEFYIPKSWIRHTTFKVFFSFGSLPTLKRNHHLGHHFQVPSGLIFAINLKHILNFGLCVDQFQKYHYFATEMNITLTFLLSLILFKMLHNFFDIVGGFF